MKITLPPDFDYDHPHLNLLYCPTCNKYQHFAFNRVRHWMECCGCGARHTWYGMEEMQPDTNERKGNRRPKYGPPKFLLCMNAVIRYPD